MKILTLGGGGEGDPPLGNFSHIIPFFSDHVPYERFWWGILCFTYIACSVYWLLSLGDAHHVVGNAGPKRFPTSRLGPHQQINLLNRDPLPKKVNISCQIVFYSFKRPCSSGHLKVSRNPITVACLAPASDERFWICIVAVCIAGQADGAHLLTVYIMCVTIFCKCCNKLDQVYCAWLIKRVIKREIIQLAELCLTKWWIAGGTSWHWVIIHMTILDGTW